MNSRQHKVPDCTVLVTVCLQSARLDLYGSRAAAYLLEVRICISNSLRCIVSWGGGLSITLEIRDIL